MISSSEPNLICAGTIHTRPRSACMMRNINGRSSKIFRYFRITQSIEETFLKGSLEN